MPIISGTTAPTFELPGVQFTGLAAPSRGSTESCVWRIQINSQEVAPPHRLDREEIIVAVAGAAVATLDGHDRPVRTGDAIVIPAGVPFALRAAGAVPFEGVAVMPVGGRACFDDGDAFAPPWTE